MGPPSQTVRAQLAAAEAALVAAGRDEAPVLAEWLVSEAAGLRRLDLLVRGDAALSDTACAALREWTRRVAAGEPLQYVVGHTSFFGRDFQCDPRALIPRPETEELCDRILADARIWRDPAPVVLDIGTGTGCIAITLALEQPAARVTAVDLSPDALALARSNAKRLGVEGRIAWRRGDLLDGVEPASARAIVSNPPYVSEAEFATLDPTVREHEPALALVSGPEGLDIIRRLAVQAGLVLAPGGILWLEIGNEQGSAVCQIVRDSGFDAVALHRDLAGHDRIVEARRP
ncbi:MAG: peptide chain release factor N(5)-glutamine methyltransferase [Verrucomicrobia bacterium]|nr:peptide chain release factor N(5)-glutamine methyltransferase [Kiritimatiellia bacterium]MCO6401263.1 peptide chain release factor N(5)-glutamine methyltransferase [Verrucomicrobiota bacterium]